MALVSAFVPLWQIALFIAIIIGIYIGIESPEFLFLTSIAVIPFLNFIPNSDIVLATALIITAISFTIKVMYGKSVFYLVI